LRASVRLPVGQALAAAGQKDPHRVVRTLRNPSQLSNQRLALLLGRLSELVHSLTDEPPDPLIWNGLGVLECCLRLLDRVNGVGHRPRRLLASALLTRLGPFLRGYVAKTRGS